MSKFSYYLKYLIDRNTQSIAQLSRMSGVERTSIHKALTDERILSYKSAEKLSQAFCLSPSEKAQFFKYHSMLLQGEDTYEVRQMIIQILHNLADLPLSSIFEKKTSWSNTYPTSSGEQMFFGDLAVTDIVKYVLDQEVQHQDAPQIYLNFSLEDSFLKKYISLLYRQTEKNIHISHIIPFPYRKNMETSARYGLKILEWILPLCLVADNQYEPFFYYDHSAVSYYSDPLPYYILTTNFLLCLSQDMKTAIIHTDPKLMEYYRQYAADTIECCEPFLTYTSDPFNILNQYMDNSTMNGYYTIMIQPCPGKFYTREFIEAKIPKELPFYRELVEATDRRFRMLRELTGNYYTIFTYEGLKDFFDTGIFCDMPKEYVDACTMKERLSLMRQLRDHIADDRIIGLVVNPSTFRIPEYLTFTIEPDKGTHIFTNLMYEGKAYYCNMHIIEPMLSKSFFDFIISLPNSEYVYSKEETLQILDTLLAQYSAGEPS